jgi:hypothetical protein
MARTIDIGSQSPAAVRRPGAHGATVALWPEEYLEAWDRANSRLFIAALAQLPLESKVAARITIRGTGIGATVSGVVVAARRIGGPGVTPGVFVGISSRGMGPSLYLERVARGLPVDFNERDPRYAVQWRVSLRCAGMELEATTLNVSDAGCLVTWPGPPLEVGEPVVLRPRLLFGPTLSAAVCWESGRDGAPRSAGLRLTAEGRAARRWRTAVQRAVLRGALPA